MGQRLSTVHHTDLFGYLRTAQKLNKRQARIMASSLWVLLVHSSIPGDYNRLYLPLICRSCGLPYGECQDNIVESETSRSGWAYTPSQTNNWMLGRAVLLSSQTRSTLEHEEFSQFGPVKRQLLLGWLNHLRTH
jgi:hypothetical protein